jgi:hypothetical protein
MPPIRGPFTVYAPPVESVLEPCIRVGYGKRYIYMNSLMVGCYHTVPKPHL